MNWIDTHSHLDSEPFEATLSDVVQRAAAAGVSAMITVGTTLASSRRAVEIARTHPQVHAVVGIQPNDAASATQQDWEAIIELVHQPGVVGLGETGIDHYWDDAPLDVQQSWFERHIQFSMTSGLPLVIHMREGKHGNGTDSCARAILATLERVALGSPVRGVMHSYTGSAELVPEFVGHGLYVSFAGMVTYKNADAIRAAARRVPPERILIETDAPYLSPQPHRGKFPNEPAWVRCTGEFLAHYLGYTDVEFARMTSDNARRLFQLTAKK